MTLSSGQLSRNGTIINQQGLSTENFLKNPIMLFNHDYDTPIGSWKNVEHKNGVLTGDPVFSNTQKAKEVEQLWNDKVLRAASVGVSIEKYSFDKNDNFIIEESDLLEVSIVSIPANTDAVKQKLNQSFKLHNMDEKVLVSLQKEISDLKTQLKAAQTHNKAYEKRDEELKKENLEKLGVSPELAEILCDKLTTVDVSSLVAELDKTTKSNRAPKLLTGEFSKMGVNEILDKSPETLIELAKNDPDAYNNLFKD